MAPTVVHAQSATRSMAARLSDEPLWIAASRSSNWEPSPSGMAVANKLKIRRLYGSSLTRQTRRHFGIIKIALPARRQPQRAQVKSVFVKHTSKKELLRKRLRVRCWTDHSGAWSFPLLMRLLPNASQRVGAKAPPMTGSAKQSVALHQNTPANGERYAGAVILFTLALVRPRHFLRLRACAASAASFERR